MPTLLLTAAAVIDAHSVAAAPGALLLDVSTFDGVVTRLGGFPGSWCRARCLLAGPAGEVAMSPLAAGAKRIDLPTSILIPGLVNAHTHLDLTNIGPRPHDATAGFIGFARLVMQSRPRDEAGVRAAVREGVRMSMAGGVVAVGDIGGMIGPLIDTWVADELKKSPLMGTSFGEFFAMSQAAADRLDTMLAPVAQPVHERGRVRRGLSPHAPYSVSARGYARAMQLCRDLELPVSTHLAESVHEREAVVHARGPAVELLKSLGVYDDEAQRWLGHARSPVDLLREVIARGGKAAGAPLSLVHCNDLSDADVDVLDASGASVIYCPRSSEYFDAPGAFGPHRYRELLGRSVNVALGTDSIINLPAGSDRISPWDEAVVLYQRDRTPPTPRTLLAMMTTSGARAIGLSPAAFVFAASEGPRGLAGVAAVEVGAAGGQSAEELLEAALVDKGAPSLVVLGSPD